MQADPAAWARILILADDPAHAGRVERVFRAAGYADVRSSTDLAAALPLVAGLQPDLLFLDLRRPHRAAVQVVEALRRQRPAHIYLPILVLARTASRPVTSPTPSSPKNRSCTPTLTS